MTVDLAQRTPVEIDTEIAALWTERFTVEAAIRRAIDSVHTYGGDRQVRRSGSRHATWGMTFEEAKAATPASWYQDQHTRAIAEVAARRIRYGHLSDQIGVLEDEFDRRPWSRFFLVQGGHIHESMRCSTCYPTTQFGWLPDLSGLTEAEAVAAHGPLLCSVCYPSAPVEWRLGPDALKAAGRCEGSGEYVTPTNGANAYRPYGHCPVCRYSGTLTKNLKVRAHKPEGAK